MNIALFICLLVLFQFVYLVAGKIASRNVTSSEDYFLAGKGIKFFPLMMTFIATQLGGGLLLGAADEAYHYGWYILLYPLGNCLGFVVLALGLGKRLAQFKVSTVAQLFEVVYDSPNLKKIASVISMLSLFMILAAQVIASRKFLISIGFEGISLFLFFWGIVIIYTAIGGIKAIVSIDIIQTIFLITIFVATFAFVFYTIPIGTIQILQDGFHSNFFELHMQKLSSWLLMPLLFMVIEQDMAQRCFAAQSPALVTRAAGCSAVVIFCVCSIPISFAVIANQMGMNIEQGSSVFMDAIQTLTNPTLTAFIGCTVMMAVLTSSISYINALSSNLSQDFDLKILGQGINQTKGLTALIGIAAVAASFFFTGIVDLLILSFAIPVYCLFIPVVFALFKPKGNSLSALLAMVGGGAGFIVSSFWPMKIPNEIFCLATSLTGFALGLGINLQVPVKSKIN